MPLNSTHHHKSCHCIYGNLSAFKTAPPMFVYMSQLHARVPRVSEAAAVVLDLALCSQNSPLSTPTIRNWHRSCVLRDWNLRVRTDLHQDHPSGSQTDNMHVCKWTDRRISTNGGQGGEGTGGPLPYIWLATWHCKPIQLPC